MIRLFDNPFSPFARKVHLVLDFKEIAFESLDALDPDIRQELIAHNARGEVPMIEDRGVYVSNSSDIVAYLDFAYPDRPVLPRGLSRRVRARAWERKSDTLVDAITVDISLWSWANRPDDPPEGMLDAARRDLEGVYAELELEICDGEFIVGELSIADLALFPHLYSARVLGVGIDAGRFPRLGAWLTRMAEMPICAADLVRLADWIPKRVENGLEMDKIAWRGDRLEWLLARGYHDWLVDEIRNDRVIWPI